MNDERIVDDLHPDESQWLEGNLPLETVDQRRVQFVDEYATKVGVRVQHDYFVAEACDDHLVLLSA